MRGLKEIVVFMIRVSLLSSSQKNIRISGIAWELLRWAKIKLRTKSYSETIIELNANIGKNRYKKVQNSLEFFEKQHEDGRHRIKVKTPDSPPKRLPDSELSKTILLNYSAYDILEEIKSESRLPAYTFSYAIEFLVKENKKIIGDFPAYLKD
jgi:predicted CopG family antitoxin